MGDDRRFPHLLEYFFFPLRCKADCRPECTEKVGLLARNPWAEAQGVKTDVCIEIWSLIGQRHAPSSPRGDSRTAPLQKWGQEAGKLTSQARGANRQTV